VRGYAPRRRCVRTGRCGGGFGSWDVPAAHPFSFCSCSSGRATGVWRRRLPRRCRMRRACRGRRRPARRSPAAPPSRSTTWRGAERPARALPEGPGVARPPPPGSAVAGRLAVTSDDLPGVGPLPPGGGRAGATSRLLAALAEYSAPAAGFVDCARVERGAPTLRLWLDAGHVLGNHTEDHVALDRVDPSAWI